MSKALNSDGMTVDISSNQNQSTPLGKTETSGTLRHPLDKLQKFLKGNLKALGVSKPLIKNFESGKAGGYIQDEGLFWLMKWLA